ncbi:hypothetical protein [Acetobacter cibinongensis]|uniref:Uncharacterized protein n=1 Tax=Acetobacter cibinongensis TaxID=146475 RepID=A0A1Z5YW21_9PROT|nr:hypothetical protein [Acetobacter cibinongensis]OUJ03179.1 hypothetical protein HK14_03170 [Acetobacter cibinongensis]
MTVPFSARFVASIKNATLKAVNAIHDFEAAAGFTRVSKTQVHAYVNKDSPLTVPLDVAIDLDQAAGHAPILCAYAATLGYVAVPLHVGPGDFGEDMSTFAVASGDILATAMRILDDGRIDPHEALEIAPKLMQGKQILERAIAYIHKVQTENRPRIVSEREAG